MDYPIEGRTGCEPVARAWTRRRLGLGLGLGAFALVFGACAMLPAVPAAQTVHNADSTPWTMSPLPNAVQQTLVELGWGIPSENRGDSIGLAPDETVSPWTLDRRASGEMDAGELRWFQRKDWPKHQGIVLGPQPFVGPSAGPNPQFWPRWFHSFDGRGAAILGDTVVTFDPTGPIAGYRISRRPTDPKQPNRLQVLVYNAFFLDGLFATDVERRGPALIQYLRAGHKTLGAWDVLVLPELFHDGVREAVISGVKDLYPYASNVLGSSRVRIGNGGVLVLSRWPLLVEDEVIFDDCTDYDCGAAKGGRYVRILKGKRTFHLVATHMQSRNWPRAQRIRQRQVQQLADLAARQNIRPSEPLIYAGDFNIDALQPDIGPGPGHAEMLYRLNGQAVAPPALGPCRYSYDPRTNKTALASYDTGWRDQVIVTRQTPAMTTVAGLEFPVVTLGAKPTLKRLPACHTPRAGALDLSDHYAVTARLDFLPL